MIQTLLTDTATPPINILLIDDRPENLLALESMLGDMGHTLVKAQSGTEALKCLLREDFALILLDVQMPGLDGFETAELIHGRERSRNTPIIFLTALDRSEAGLYRGYSVGAVDFLFKPLVPEVLRSKVAVFVDLFRKTQQNSAAGRRAGAARPGAHRRAAGRQRCAAGRDRRARARRGPAALFIGRDHAAQRLAGVRADAAAADGAGRADAGDVGHGLNAQLRRHAAAGRGPPR